jgi:hypothetical protein
MSADQFIAALLAARIVCPVHGIPDCSPLLNGCSVPRYIAEWRGEFIGDLRAALDTLPEVPA